MNARLRRPYLSLWLVPVMCCLAGGRSAVSDEAPATGTTGAARAADDDRVELPLSEWRRRLTPQQFRITRMKGTEPAFSGRYWLTKAKGTYHCVCCDLPLYHSSAKYNSGTGWPSFWKPIDEKTVKFKPDVSALPPRMEVVCRRCDAHLGHVFSDGPPPTGARFCINSAALRLELEKPARPGRGESDAPGRTDAAEDAVPADSPDGTPAADDEAPR